MTLQTYVLSATLTVYTDEIPQDMRNENYWSATEQQGKKKNQSSYLWFQMQLCVHWRKGEFVGVSHASDMTLGTSTSACFIPKVYLPDYHQSKINKGDQSNETTRLITKLHHLYVIWMLALQLGQLRS